MPPAEINYFAVLAAAVVNMVVGFVWYSPNVFGKMWIEALGKKWGNCSAEMKKEASKTYFLSFLSALIMGFVLSIIVYYMQATNMTEGVKVGFLVWLGFVATISLNSYLFEKKPKILLLINAGYYLVSLICMAVVLAVMA